MRKNIDYYDKYLRKIERSTQSFIFDFILYGVFAGLLLSGVFGSSTLILALGIGLGVGSALSFIGAIGSGIEYEHHK